MFWFSHYGTAAFEPETAVEVPLLLLLLLLLLPPPPPPLLLLLLLLALVRALQET